jgi:hypothetical protein
MFFFKNYFHKLLFNINFFGLKYLTILFCFNFLIQYKSKKILYQIKSLAGEIL